MDSQIGRLLDGLERQGLLEDSYVVLVAGSAAAGWNTSVGSHTLPDRGPGSTESGQDPTPIAHTPAPLCELCAVWPQPDQVHVRSEDRAEVHQG